MAKKKIKAADAEAIADAVVDAINDAIAEAEAEVKEVKEEVKAEVKVSAPVKSRSITQKFSASSLSTSSTPSAIGHSSRDFRRK